MSQTNTLDLTGLQGKKGQPGVTIDAHEYGFVQSATQNADGSYTVGAGQGDLTNNSLFHTLATRPSATVTFQVQKLALPSLATQHPTGPVYRVFAEAPSFFGTGRSIVNQIGASPKGQELFVLGWNAHSILLEVVGLGIPAVSIVIISDQDLTNGEPSDTHFSNDGSVPAPFGLNIIPVTMACFAAGTRITTPGGPVAVEDLREGDWVLTVSGLAQPICWIGHDVLRCAAAPQPARILPVRVAADSFGPGLPVRDLLLSPEHALFADGALVPVHYLINGSTIRQETVETITYYHVELPRHDVLFAEGLPAESYLDTGNRDTLIRRDRIACAA